MYPGRPRRGRPTRFAHPREACAGQYLGGECANSSSRIEITPLTVVGPAPWNAAHCLSKQNAVLCSCPPSTGSDRFEECAMLKVATLFAVVAGLAAAQMPTQAASAPAISVAGAKGDPNGAVILIHEGCHYGCRYSPRLGWHNHSNTECRPEPCREQRHRGERPYGRGHDDSCHYDCRYSRELGWHNHSNLQCRPEPCRDRD